MLVVIVQGFAPIRFLISTNDCACTERFSMKTHGFDSWAGQGPISNVSRGFRTCGKEMTLCIVMLASRFHILLGKFDFIGK